MNAKDPVVYLVILIHFKMKKITTYPNGEIEIELDDILEVISLYEVGDWIEFEGRDYLIIEKKEKRLILR